MEFWLFVRGEIADMVGQAYVTPEGPPTVAPKNQAFVQEPHGP